jgi:hypothetical protein
MSKRNDAKEPDPMQAGRDAAADLANLVFLIVLVVLFFLEVILRKQVFFAGDIMNVYSPWQWYNQEAVGTGRIPLWTDDFFMGFPLFAESQGALFYPPTRFIYAIFPAVRAFSMDVLLHFLLASWFMYFFARTLKLPPVASLLSAVVFAFSGMFMSLPINFTIFRSVVWIPVVFMFATMGARKGSFFFPLLTSLAIVLQAMGGSLQVVGITIVALAIYVFFLMLSPGEGKQASVVPLMQFILTLMLSLGLYAFQLYPTWELTQLAWRGTQGGYDVAASFSFPPIHMIDALFPTFFGAWSEGSRLPMIPDAPNFFPYIGLVPLLLIPLALSSRRRGMAVMFLLVVLFVVLALGKHGYLYEVVYYTVPFFDKFRAPDRFWFIAIFAGSLLAGYGLDRLVAAIDDDKRVASMSSMGLIALITLLGALFVAGAIYTPALRSIWESATAPLVHSYLRPERMGVDPDLVSRWQNHLLMIFLHALLVVTAFHYAIAAFGKKGRGGTLAGALIIIAAADLYAMSFSIPALKTTKTSFFLDPPRSASVIMRDGEPNRFYAIGKTDYAQSIFHFTSADAQTAWYNGGGSNSIEDYYAFREELSPNIGMHWGLQSSSGFASLFMDRYFQLEGIANQQLQAFVGSVDREYIQQHGYPGAGLPVPEWADRPLLIDLMATRYVLTPFDFSPLCTGEGGRFDLVDGGPMRVYRNNRAFPRAWIARPARIVDETLSTLRQLSNGELNPTESLMLSPAPQHRTVYPEGSEGVATARIRYGRGAGPDARGGAIRDETVIVEVSTPQDAYLVVADTHYPGWVAEVDSQPVETIYRAFGYFRAVEVPAGEHIVTFYYRPMSFAVGKIFSLVTLATFLLLLLIQVFFFSKPKPDFKRE